MADSSPMATPTIPAPEPELDGPAPRRRYAFWLTMLAVVALVGSWVYVLFIYDPGLMIDELPDRTFPEAAEQVCAAAIAEYSELPLANESDSADARADTLDTSNEIFSRMVAELRPLADDAAAVYTAEDEQRYATGIADWVDDWGTYLDDRVDYAERLRTDDDARFLETAKGSDTKGITRAINSFAQVNKMMSCVTPGDVS